MHVSSGKQILIFALVLSWSAMAIQTNANADPSKYPEFAQQTLPENVTPAFINVDELVELVKAGTKPMIIDVRTDEEFKEAHILGAMSAPLAEFKNFVKDIPRDRPVALY
jgi:hypothetical protein